jgi:hypothetical protein
MKRIKEEDEEKSQKVKESKKIKKDKIESAFKNFKLYAFVISVSVFLVVLFILALVGAIGLGQANSIKSNLLIHRYCVTMTNKQVFDSPPGDTDGWGNGFVEFNLQTNVMYYDFLFANLGTITAIHIHGPVTGTDPLTAVIFLPSDGTSLSTTLVNNEISGSLRITVTQGDQVVNDPTNYYVLVKTSGFPGGAIGSRFGSQCNTYRT